MNRLIFLIFCMILFVATKGQGNYAEAIKEGDNAFSRQQYKTAINKYFAAEAFDPTKKDEVKVKVNRVFDRIEALRTEADTARVLALKDKERALHAEKEQGIQKNIALKQTEKLQLLNSFMNYNNEQLFSEIQRDKDTILYYALREYHLLAKYHDSLLDDNYRFNALLRISGYYERNHNLDSAYQWADRMCMLYPGSAVPFLQRSIINYYKGHWKAALADINQSLQLNPDEYSLGVIKLNKALILCNLGRYKDSRNTIQEAIKLLKQMPEKDVWSDDFVAEEIIEATSIYTIFIYGDFQVKALEIYTTINNIYAGILPIRALENIGKQKLHTSILLSIINYTATHLKAMPNDYIGYLVNGYFWEMAKYPEAAKEDYRIFLKKNKERQNKKYNQYKNMFRSKIYNKLKS